MNQVLEILQGEFSTYYTLDDLPKTWDESTLKVELPRMAMNSAERLKRRAGANGLQISDLITTLDYLETRDMHDFAGLVSGFDTPNWQEADNLRVLYYLCRTITDILKN
jgi:hypothetical protein